MVVFAAALWIGKAPPILFAAMPAASAGSFPATTQNADTRPAYGEVRLSDTIQKAIHDLDSPDFDVREAATRLLGRIGDPAEAALRNAAESTSPEVSQRAQNLLASLAFGIRPDTPEELVNLVKMWEESDADNRGDAVSAITQFGAQGTRVLIKMLQLEQNGDLREKILDALTQASRAGAAEMIAGDELRSARQLLEATSTRSETAARDYAAFLYLSGDLPEAILKQGAGPADERHNLRATFLYRAAGDLPAAIDRAARLSNPTLRYNLLADAGRFKELAVELEKKGVADDDVEDLGLLTAFHRLAGNAQAAEADGDRLVRYGGTLNAADHGNAVEALMLNGQADKGIALLLQVHDYAAAADFLAARNDFDQLEQVVRLATQAGGQPSGDAPLVMCKAAVMRHFQGRDSQAIELLASIARGDYGQLDFGGWSEVVEAAASINAPPELQDLWMAQALVVARPQDNAGALFSRLNYQDASEAADWWDVLRDPRSGNSPQEALALTRRLDRHDLPRERFDDLLEKTRTAAADLPPRERDARLRLVAQALVEFDRNDEAISLLKSLSGSSSITDQMSLGKIYLASGKWEAALHCYDAATKSAPQWPMPVALQAVALDKLGRHDEARQKIATAHLMPLANEGWRHALAQIFSENGLPAEATREHELCATLGDPTLPETCDSLRRLGDEAAKTDPARAVSLWNRAYLANLSRKTSFVEQVWNLAVPVQVLQNRAVARVRAGDTAGAVADAQQCFALMPADADAQAVVINALSEAHRVDEADALYRQAFDRYDGWRKQYSSSGPANNLIAWFCALSHRDLDHALTAARAAVDLEPTNTAILDTLSEVYFARGETELALKINARCRELEPRVQHHQQNFERFSAARKK